MKSCYFFIGLLTFFWILPSNVSGQDPEVSNIQLDIKQNRVHIHYDILNSQPSMQHDVDVLFLDQDYKYFDPQELSGDIGNQIRGGADKDIVWDAMADRFDFSRKVTPQIFLDWEKRGGADNALLSLLVPGLGDYFVAETKEMTIKPYMRTLSALGFVTLGFIAQNKRKDVPLYTYSDMPYIDTETGDYLSRTGRVLYGHETQPWLFGGDAEVFLSVGAAIWVADILWVAVKGFQNEKINQYLTNTNFQLNNQGIALSYGFTF